MKNLLKLFKPIENTLFPFYIKDRLKKEEWKELYPQLDYNTNITSDIVYTDQILEEMKDFFLIYKNLDINFLIEKALKKIELNLNTIFIWDTTSLTWKIRNIEEACSFLKLNIIDELIEIELKFKKIEIYCCNESSISLTFLKIRDQINKSDKEIKKETISYMNRTDKTNLITFNNQFPFLIGFGDNYVLNLKTKEKRIRKYDDYFTYKIENRNLVETNVEKCYPITDWFEPIDIKNIQTILGSFLTGEHDQSFYIFHGDGSNGKSTLINILRNLLGDYVVEVTSKLFSDKNTLKLEEDYNLVNKRLAILDIQEINNFNETKLITLVEKYKNCKFLLSLNELPKFSSKYSTKRRLINIPFEYTFKSDVFYAKDKKLKKYLEIDYDYIFSWLLEGCIRYTNSGETITSSVKDYITKKQIFEFDLFEDFAKNAITISDSVLHNESFRDLYETYLNYTKKRANEETNTELLEFYKTPLKEKDFLQTAKKRYVYKRTKAGNKFLYIIVKQF